MSKKTTFCDLLLPGWMRALQFSRTELLILALVWQFVSFGNHFFMTEKKIAHELGVSRKTVCRAMVKLIEAKVLERKSDHSHAAGEITFTADFLRQNCPEEKLAKVGSKTIENTENPLPASPFHTKEANETWQKVLALEGWRNKKQADIATELAKLKSIPDENGAVNSMLYTIEKNYSTIFPDHTSRNPAKEMTVSIDASKRAEEERALKKSSDKIKSAVLQAVSDRIGAEKMYGAFDVLSLHPLSIFFTLNEQESVIDVRCSAKISNFVSQYRAHFEQAISEKYPDYKANILLNDNENRYQRPTV